MKSWLSILCMLIPCSCVQAQAAVWQPTDGHTQMPIWPGPSPNSQTIPGPEYSEIATSDKPQFAGKPVTGIHNVSRPTMTVYSPIGSSTGAAVVVFPGGGFEELAMDLEGTEACDWLTSKGITCVLLKYRVPSPPYNWHCDCRPHNFALSTPSLQDAQRTIRLVRANAREWHIDPHKIGVLGFSAGGYLVAEISTNFTRELYAPVDATDKESARPDFAMAIYPGHLVTYGGKLNPNVSVLPDTPPTFLVHAEDDDTDPVNQSLLYYSALIKAHVPAELHVFAHGGHAFGLRATALPITHWPTLADTWLSGLGIARH